MQSIITQLQLSFQSRVDDVKLQHVHIHIGSISLINNRQTLLYQAAGKCSTLKTVEQCKTNTSARKCLCSFTAVMPGLDATLRLAKHGNIVLNYFTW